MVKQMKLERIAVVCHPTRFKILELLLENEEGLYIQQLAEKTGENRKINSYHLRALERHDLLHSELKSVKKPDQKGYGVAARFFNITALGRLIYNKLTLLLMTIERQFQFFYDITLTM